MKKIGFIFFALLALSFWGCETETEKTVLPESVTPNQVTSPTGATVLSLENADVNVNFTWTSLDFGYSLPQKYTLQIAKAGTNFATAYDIVAVNDLEGSITQGKLNAILLNFIDGGVAGNVDIRVKTIISSYVDPYYSATKTVSMTPYQTVFPPIYIIGSSTGGWDPNLAVEMRSSAPNVYSTIAYFSNTTDNNTFRFFKQAGWGDSWNCPFFTGGFPTALLENAADGDSNFRLIGASGYYSITAKLAEKKVDMTAVDEPVMYMTGDGVGSGAWGWDPGQYVKMTWKSNGKWEATTTFTNGKAFRFFIQTGWGTSYNYPYFADGTVTALLTNAADGDSNFRVVAATGTYKITVNMLDLVVSMEPAK